jgi:hypothetical protein
MSAEKHVRDLLGPADPVRRVPVPPPRLSAARLISSAGNAPATDNLQLVRRPNRRLVLAAGGVAAVAAASGLSGVGYRLLRRGDGPAPVARRTPTAAPDPTAARPTPTRTGSLVVPIAYQIRENPPPAGRYLRDLATRIGDAPYDLHTGRYTYHHARSWGGAQTETEQGYVIKYVDETELWVAPDGSGRKRYRILGAEYPDEASRRYWESATPRPPTTPPTTPTPTRRREYDDLPAGMAGPTAPLGADPAELRRQLDPAAGLATLAMNLHNVCGFYGLPRATRAALLNLLATVPGLVWRGTVTDRAGRAGVAVTGEEKGQQALLVFDPATGELLAHEQVLAGGMPRVAAYWLILSTDRTDRVG